MKLQLNEKILSYNGKPINFKDYDETMEMEITREATLKDVLKLYIPFPREKQYFTNFRLFEIMTSLLKDELIISDKEFESIIEILNLNEIPVNSLFNGSVINHLYKYNIVAKKEVGSSDGENHG